MPDRKPAQGDDRPRYRVLRGLDYDNDRKHAEAGKIVRDLPPELVPELIEAGVIEPVGDEQDERERDGGE